MTRELLPFDFDVVRGAAPDVPYKPDPAAALAIAAEMGLRPEEFVFVGDTSIDMETARGGRDVSRRGLMGIPGRGRAGRLGRGRAPRFPGGPPGGRG